MKKIVVSAFAALVAGGAMAAWSPLGVGIVAPAQLPYMSSDVLGVRLNCLLSRNEDVWGLDIGLAGVAHGSEYALQCGLFDVVYGDSAGFQIAGVGYNGGMFAGLQVAGLCSWNGLAAYGVQISAVNADQTEFHGLSFGALNYADALTGGQIGFLNLADSVYGVQIGCINACDKMDGLQLGLVNLISSSRLPVMVLANAWF